MTSPTASETWRGAEPVLRLDAVSVRYRVAIGAPLSLKEALLSGQRRQVVEHAALDEVTLAVGRGEALGVVGGNGAGKTTLLNVVARVILPSAGRLRIRGRVAPLIDLTGGFHPELTGRENVYLRGAVLGRGRTDMRARVDAIAGFADIGRFFDAPLRTYSTGMIVRLGFAIAVNLDGDILLIDEALAVGDAGFQEKCGRCMRELRERGVTFVTVSHDVPTLARTCDRLLWLESGRVRAIGPAAAVAGEYLAAHGPR